MRPEVLDKGWRYGRRLHKSADTGYIYQPIIRKIWMEVCPDASFSQMEREYKYFSLGTCRNEYRYWILTEVERKGYTTTLKHNFYLE